MRRIELIKNIILNRSLPFTTSHPNPAVSSNVELTNNLYDEAIATAVARRGRTQ